MRTYLLLALCSGLCFGCVSVNRGTHGKVKAPAEPLPRLTLLQYFFLHKYCVLRLKATETLELPKGATAEEIRPRAAKYLELPADTTLEEMAEDWRVQVILTESLRQKIVKIFRLPKDESWIRIKDRAEKSRLRMGR